MSQINDVTSNQALLYRTRGKQFTNDDYWIGGK